MLAASCASWGSPNQAEAEARPDWSTGATLTREEAPGRADGVGVVSGESIVVRVSMPKVCRTIVTTPQVVKKRAPGTTGPNTTTKKVIAYGALVAAGALGHRRDIAIGSPQTCTRTNCSGDPTDPTLGSRIAANAVQGPPPDMDLDTEETYPLVQTSDWEECGVTQVTETPVRVQLGDGTFLHAKVDPVGRARIDLSGVAASKALVDHPVVLLRVNDHVVGTVDLRGGETYERWWRTLHPARPASTTTRSRGDSWF